MGKSKDKFYKKLNIDKETKEVIKYYNKIKEALMKEKDSKRS